MSISLIDFLQQLTRSVPLLITVILTIGVILVNGWTDAVSYTHLYNVVICK